MSLEGDDVQEMPIEETSLAKMPLEEALKEVLKISMIHDGLARGIREASKALDRCQAHLCVLCKGNDEETYKKLVIGLCTQNNIPLIQVDDAKELGEWAGLCKFDREGNARKVVGCSVVAIRDYGRESQGLRVLQEHFKTQKA